MKRLAIIFTITFFILSGLAVKAKNDSHQDRREKYRSEKVAFLTSNLELTPAEAEKFWPVYNQMDQERWEAQKMRREMEAKVRETKVSLPEKEVIALTRKFAGILQEEADMLVKYNEKFLKILPPQKVLKLYQVENEFRMHMISKYRESRKSEN